MDDRARLADLIAQWHAIGRSLQADPNSAHHTAQAQQVGSEILTLCHQLGINPVLALTSEGEG